MHELEEDSDRPSPVRPCLGSLRASPAVKGYCIFGLLALLVGCLLTAAGFRRAPDGNIVSIVGPVLLAGAVLFFFKALIDRLREQKLQTEECDLASDDGFPRETVNHRHYTHQEVASHLCPRNVDIQLRPLLNERYTAIIFDAELSSCTYTALSSDIQPRQDYEDAAGVDPLGPPPYSMCIPEATNPAPPPYTPHNLHVHTKHVKNEHNDGDNNTMSPSLEPSAALDLAQSRSEVSGPSGPSQGSGSGDASCDPPPPYTAQDRDGANSVNIYECSLNHNGDTEATSGEAAEYDL